MRILSFLLRFPCTNKVKIGFANRRVDILKELLIPFAKAFVGFCRFVGSVCRGQSSFIIVQTEYVEWSVFDRVFVYTRFLCSYRKLFHYRNVIRFSFAILQINDLRLFYIIYRSYLAFRSKKNFKVYCLFTIACRNFIFL